VSELVAAATEWLAAPGPPNWVFVTAVVTAPAYWSETVRGRLGPLVDQLIPGKAKKDGAEEKKEGAGE